MFKKVFLGLSTYGIQWYQYLMLFEEVRKEKFNIL